MYISSIVFTKTVSSLVLMKMVVSDVYCNLDCFILTYIYVDILANSYKI